MPATTVKSGTQINTLFKNGAKIHSASFMLLYLPNMEAKGLEFAAIAGKKVFKLAVERNFIKRRIRELIRQIPVSESKDIQIAILAKKQLATIKYSQLINEINISLAQCKY